MSPSLLLEPGGTIAAVALARALPLLPEHAGSLSCRARLPRY
jgi:hypothetical protein